MHMRWLILCFLVTILIFEVSCKRGGGRMGSKTFSSKSKSSSRQSSGSSLFSSKKKQNQNKYTQPSAPAAKPQKSPPTQNQANSNQMVHSAPTNQNPSMGQPMGQVPNGAQNYQGPHMGFSAPGQHGASMGQPMSQPMGYGHNGYNAPMSQGHGAPMGNGYGSPAGYGSPMGGAPMGSAPMGYGAANQAPKSNMLSNVGSFGVGAVIGALAHRGLSGGSRQHHSSSKSTDEKKSKSTFLCPEYDFKELVSCCNTLPEYLFSEVAILACNNNVRDEAFVALVRDYVMNKIENTTESLMNKNSPASCFTTCLFRNYYMLNEDNAINIESANIYFKSQVEVAWQEVMRKAVFTCNNQVPIGYSDAVGAPAQCNNAPGFLLQCIRRKLLRFCPSERLQKSEKCIKNMYVLQKCAAFENSYQKVESTVANSTMINNITETTTISTESTTISTTISTVATTVTLEPAKIEAVPQASSTEDLKNIPMEDMLKALSSTSDGDD